MPHTSASSYKQPAAGPTSPRVANTMKILPVDRRVAGAIGTALACISAFRCCFVRGERRAPYGLDRKFVSDVATVETKTCNTDPLEFNANATHRVFQFKCDTNMQLHPVEKEAAGRTTNPTTDQLAKVYVFTPETRSAKPACVAAEQEQTLDKLVPQSALTVVNNTAKGVAQEEAVDGLVFQLSLGPAPGVDRHLCYTCTPGAGAGARTNGCTIYVTVPKKEPNENETRPDTDSGAGPGTDNQKPEQPPSSGALMPSMSGWITPSVAGCALGLVLRQ